MSSTQAPSAAAAAPAALLPPAPRLPLPAGRTETAHVALARARRRGAPAPDVVVFVAACPGCGQDVQWREEREDTRLRVSIVCDC